MVGWATPSLPHPCKAYRIGSLACFGAGTAYFKLSLPLMIIGPPRSKLVTGDAFTIYS